MKNNHRGFIPLVAIILLGLVVAGGTVATISIQKSRSGESGGAVLEQRPPLAPVSNGVESSGEVTTNTTSNQLSAPVGQIEPSVEVRVTVDPQIEEICGQARVMEASKQSLLGSIQLLCDRVTTGQYPGVEGMIEVQESIEEKWSLWSKTQKTEESAQNRAKDIENGTR